MDQIVERPKQAETQGQSIENALGLDGGSRRRGRRWIWLVLFLLVAAGAAYAWWSTAGGTGDVGSFRPAGAGEAAGSLENVVTDARRAIS